MTQRIRLVVPILLLSVACTPPPTTPAPLRCPPGATEMVREVLYFGRSIPGGGEVTDSAWRQFLSDVVTPAFPEGLTVLNGNGQWRDANGSIASEKSTLLMLLHADDAAQEAKVLQVAESYRTRFRQEAVLHEHSLVCAEFIRERR